jgi:hypothetical protein
MSVANRESEMNPLKRFYMGEFKMESPTVQNSRMLATAGAYYHPKSEVVRKKAITRTSTDFCKWSWSHQPGLDLLPSFLLVLP